MADAPHLDGRRADELGREIRELAPYYVPDWDPGAGGVSAGLVDVFAELAAEVTERLDAVPAKHRLAFFDALGFDTRPPQAARVPVRYTVAPESPRNVAVSPGTQAVAAAGEEVRFRVGEADAFEATPARLTDVLAVEPETDRIVDHSAVVDGGSEVVLFEGTDEQAHEWFVGDAKLLAAGPGDEITLDLSTDAAGTVVESDLAWHYYGTGETAAGEDWQRFADVTVVEDGAEGVTLVLTPAGEVVEYAVDGVESRWLRCSLEPGDQPTGDRHFAVGSVHLTTSSAGAGPADRLLATDVPQPPEPGKGESILPFGDQPRPGDAFYVAAETALTKPGATATLAFTPSGDEGVRTDGGSVSGGVLSEADIRRARKRHGQLDAETVRQLQAQFDWEPPSVSWEYWDGSGWSRLPDLTDGTAGFVAGGTGPHEVTFTVPPDLAQTSAAGHGGHWIRARLVGGHYGQVVHVPENEDETRWVREERGSPPEYDALAVGYEDTTRHDPDAVRTHNALGATAVGDNESFVPFRQLPEDGQTLYLGFDKPLSGGPLQLLWDVDEHPYPADFAPRLKWERRTPGGDGWARLSVQDDTAGLTEQGVLGFAVPEATGASERFGRERHWIRARVTGDRFATAAPAADTGARQQAATAFETDVSGRAVGSGHAVGSGRAGLADPSTPQSRVERGRWSDHIDDGRTDELQPCGATVPTAPPGGEQSRSPPTVEGLYPNAGWARNVQQVEGEVLGGSDGERDQTFDVAEAPAIDATVWVDELTALSGPQRETLAEERPDAIEKETDNDGDLQAFWVRWETVPNLLDSGPEDRHAVVDATAGTVRFGDGTRGRIPPRGRNNVRISYETGGGAAGNVPAGAVGELVSGLPFVDEVTNPLPGVAGADAEASSAVARRAEQTLKDRGRAVLPADYERIAADASRRIARTRTIPAMDAGGTHDPGHVTVLVVPGEPDETPIPSVGLLDRVEAELGERAPASVVERDRLVVRGPSYVGVGLRVDLVAGDVPSVDAVETRVRETVSEFLHPLSGRDGEGWAFGAVPTRSDLFALLEGVDGVDHVASLVLAVSGEETVTVGEGEPQPTVAPDVLVHEGSHDVTVRLGGED